MMFNNSIASNTTKKYFLSERINYVLTLLSESRTFNHIGKTSFFDMIILEPVKEGAEVKGKLIYEGSRLAVLERKNGHSPWSKSSFILKDYGFQDQDNSFEKAFFDDLRLKFISREKGEYKFDVSQYAKNLQKDFCKYNFVWERNPQVYFSLISDSAFCEQEELYPVKIRTITIENISS
ncbi:hypothetical protein ODD08_004689 [Salmonella enterica]|nr:hypothetical protein [Salmonella enterica]